MTESLGDLLAGKSLHEPAEIKIIKSFVRDNYNSPCQVTMQERQIVIGVKGASLAGALRVRLHELQALCGGNKRLVLRIKS